MSMDKEDRDLLRESLSHGQAIVPPMGPDRALHHDNSTPSVMRAKPRLVANTFYTRTEAQPINSPIAVSLEYSTCRRRNSPRR